MNKEATYHDFSPEIITGKTCPYCFNPTKFIDSIRIYKKKSYGMVYACLNCDAWVGVHKGTDKALGRLANNRLRFYKKMAHKYFDNMWRQAVHFKKYNKKKARAKAYLWLAQQLDIHPNNCHIGMFGEERCQQVQEICQAYYKLEFDK